MGAGRAGAALRERSRRQGRRHDDRTPAAVGVTVRRPCPDGRCRCRLPDVSSRRRCAALGKAFRAWQLYLPNNPTRERAVDAARAAFAACWARRHGPRCACRCRSRSFVVGAHAVCREIDRQSDGIPWILYRDGMRELTLRRGLRDRGRLEPLLAMLQRARQAAPDDDDLVTMLWVPDFESLALSLRRRGELVRGRAPRPRDRPAPRSASRRALDGRSGRRWRRRRPSRRAIGEGPPSGLVRVDDFDSTLYFLDRRELAYLQEEVRAEFAPTRAARCWRSSSTWSSCARSRTCAARRSTRWTNLLVDLLAIGRVRPRGVHAATRRRSRRAGATRPAESHRRELLVAAGPAERTGGRCRSCCRRSTRASRAPSHGDARDPGRRAARARHSRRCWRG